jgi:putative intracellular protease/amidase
MDQFSHNTKKHGLDMIRSDYYSASVCHGTAIVPCLGHHLNL